MCKVTQWYFFQSPHDSLARGQRAKPNITPKGFCSPKELCTSEGHKTLTWPPFWPSCGLGDLTPGMLKISWGVMYGDTGVKFILKRAIRYNQLFTIINFTLNEYFVLEMRKSWKTLKSVTFLKKSCDLNCDFNQWL